MKLSNFCKELTGNMGLLIKLTHNNYVLECLEICVQTCRALKGQITPSDSTGRLQWCLNEFDELISCLQSIQKKWEEYQNILDTGSGNEVLAYRVPVVHTGRQGRPRFYVTREQLGYLASLSFTWSEIAVILWVSRTTIFRYVPIYYIDMALMIHFIIMDCL